MVERSLNCADPFGIQTPGRLKLATGFGFIVTVLVSCAVQPLSVSTLNTTVCGPAVVGVNVIDALLPPVGLPLIVQVYCVIAPALATDVEVSVTGPFTQACADVVKLTVGSGLTTTWCEAVLLTV